MQDANMFCPPSTAQIGLKIAPNYQLLLIINDLDNEQTLLLSKISSSIIFSLTFISKPEIILAKAAKSEAITCYKDVIKDPLTFYGNPGDVFTLYDGSTWKVASGGTYEYAPVRYKDVLICPAVGKLLIGNRALSISRT